MNGRQVYDGEITVVGDTSVGVDSKDEPEITYDLRCRKHWLADKEAADQYSLFDDPSNIIDLTP